MMTIIIDATAEIEATITQRAEYEGISVQEFVLRAAVDRATGNGVTVSLAQTSEADDAIDREARRKAMRKLIKSGHFARMGLSTDALFADRREELRLEAEQEARREQMRQAWDDAKPEGRS